MRLVINLIQILRWLLQPEIWRFVGFAAAVVGLLCYALSSSFIHVFGDWNLLKIFLYSVFSFIICLVILCVKIWQHSRSLRFKAHAAFLVLTITSVYSFFSDKVMNGKPDAYTLTSCAAFAIMSLSLSRQIQCGFEVDLLYFFLGCLIVQLMKLKLKLQLGIVGMGFSYFLIILRSSFYSIYESSENQHYGLQDDNSVVIEVVTHTPQLASVDFGSMMEQLKTCVEAFQRENSNVIDMLLEQIKEYLEDHSELVVTDHNFMIDALPPETIKDVQETVNMMVSAGFEKDCSKVYSSCRRECLEECLSNKIFGLQKLGIEDVHNMPLKDLKHEIERWIKVSNVALKILFPSERRLCDLVFSSSATDLSFLEVCKGSAIQLLSFVDAVTVGSRSPEQWFSILDMFETMRDLIPVFESLFCDQYSVSLRSEAITIWKRLGKAIKRIFMELRNLIHRDREKKALVASGGIHPIARYVMNYLRAVCQYRGTLEQVFEDSSLSVQMHWIMEQLESNLEEKSKLYEDPALGYLFLINNVKYIVQITEDSELGTLLGNEWIQTHTRKVSQYYGNYERTMVDLPRSGRYGGDVPQLSRKNDPQQRTMFIAASQFGNTEMPLEDGFTWRKYGQKEIRGSKHRRSYYRCTRRRLYACQAKKRVQRLDDNPSIFEVTYSGEHTCRLPSTVVDISKDMTQTTMLPQLSPSSTSVSGWLPSVNLGLSGGGADSNCGNTGPSTTKYGSDYSVAETNAMFNSGINNNGNSMESLFPPADDKWEPAGANEAMEEVQNKLREPNKDLFLEFENLILSIPEAKLVAPVDGGHHPMMNKVMIYFVSASRSRLAETSSLGKQMKMTLELLERTLVVKSENYEDPALRHFFMMNNWRHVEIVKESRELTDIFFSHWLQRYSTEKVQQNFELYQRSSWNKLLDFLELGSNESVAPNIAVEWMKGKLSLFNMHFSEMCRVQCTWFVRDENLREEIITSLENILLPAYGIFLGKFQDVLKNHAYDYIEYGLFDIKSGLNRLFS